MYHRSRAHYTRPPCPSFKRAFSAPVPQVAFVTRRTALRRTTTAPGTRLFIPLHYTPIPLFVRVLLARAQHAARALTRASLKFGLRVSPNFCCFVAVLCAPLFVRRSSQCAWFSRDAGALPAKGHARPLGDLAFPWRARERPASSRGRVPVDPRTIQEHHGVLPFRLRHLHQTTSFLRDCSHQIE